MRSFDIDNASKEALGWLAAWALVGAGLVVLVAAFAVVGTLPVFFAWNYGVAAAVPAVHQVTFVQAFALATFLGCVRAGSK